jgi:hypothetical protein
MLHAWYLIALSVFTAPTWQVQLDSPNVDLLDPVRRPDKPAKLKQHSSIPIDNLYSSSTPIATELILGVFT